MVYASSRTRALSALAHVGRVLLAACVVAVLARPAHAWEPEGPPTQWITTKYNTNNTIKVEVVDHPYQDPTGWGGVIGGIYYRPSGSGDWGSNMIDNWDAGRDLQVALYEGPASQYFNPAGPEPWSVAQGCCHGADNPVYTMGSGTSPVPWLSTRTYPYIWEGCQNACVVLDQTVYLWPTYIEVRYDLSGRPGYSCPHAVMFHETPVVFARHGYGEPYDPDRLEDEWLYDGTAPWTAGGLTDPPMPAVGYRQAYPSEHWIGLFRPGGGYGLTLAYPQRTRHQPYCHHWSFYQNEVWEGATKISDWEEQIRSRAFFDINPASGETTSWTVYVIPGTVETGRREAYNLIPHPRWEFNISTAAEGWHPVHHLTNFRVEGGKLKATSTGVDPYMHSLDYLDFASDPIYGMYVRMAVTAGTQAQLFYITEEDPNWSESKSKRFSITADGAYRTYFVRFDDIPGWTGKTIRCLRLDPTNAATGTDGIKINYMRLYVFPFFWEFNSEWNSEGWMPVTTQLWDPVWPEKNVTGGNMVLYSGGKMLDTNTDPDTWIYPTLLGPYPTYLAPTGGTRYVAVRLYFQGTGTFNARLRYTLTTDTKLFDYHPDPEHGWPDPDWPDYKLVTRFDLADHPAIEWNNKAANQWHYLTATLPSSGTIDQLELEPTDKAGKVYIDYIRVNYL